MAGNNCERDVLVARAGAAAAAEQAGGNVVVHEQPEDVHGGDGNNKQRLTVLQLQTLNCIPFSRLGKTNHSDKQKSLFASFYVHLLTMVLRLCRCCWQGAQAVGMGKDAHTVPAAAALFAKTKEILGWDTLRTFIAASDLIAEPGLCASY